MTPQEEEWEAKRVLAHQTFQSMRATARKLREGAPPGTQPIMLHKALVAGTARVFDQLTAASDKDGLRRYEEMLIHVLAVAFAWQPEEGGTDENAS